MIPIPPKVEAGIRVSLACHHPFLKHTDKKFLTAQDKIESVYRAFVQHPGSFIQLFYSSCALSPEGATRPDDVLQRWDLDDVRTARALWDCVGDWRR